MSAPSPLQPGLTIGAVTRLLGISTKTIRHYLAHGLLELAARSANGYHQYQARDIVHLQRIRRLQALGLSLAQIQNILHTSYNDASLRVVLTHVLATLDHELATLTQRRGRVLQLLGSDPHTLLDLPATPLPSMHLLLELPRGVGDFAAYTTIHKHLFTHFERQISFGAHEKVCIFTHPGLLPG